MTVALPKADVVASLPCVEQHVSLAPLTWYRIGGPARYLAEPADLEELGNVVTACRDTGMPFYPLGLGANLLVADDGVQGCVVRLSRPYWHQIKVEHDVGGTARVTAGGGTDLFKLVREMAKLGLAGVECLAGIPGTVGGGVRMNAGGKYGDLGSRLASVTILNASGSSRELSRSDLHLSYRSSALTDGDLVASATFKLFADDAVDVQRRTREVWDYKTASQPPMGKNRSCGCTFKNPPDDSAGRLIDAAGCKGLTIGGASVSNHHANFIVAGEGCRSSDVESLMEAVRRRVAEVSGVILLPEVRQWPTAPLAA